MIRGMAIIAALFLAIPAQAKHHHYQRHHQATQIAYNCVSDNSGRTVCQGRVSQALGPSRVNSFSGDPRPHAWCGWWMRRHLGVSSREGNLARWWAGYGTNAHGPAVGALVVWRHHVGIITGHTEAGWVVLSGNDGHAVRERERSLRGAIAFRWPTRMAGL